MAVLIGRQYNEAQLNRDPNSLIADFQRAQGLQERSRWLQTNMSDILNIIDTYTTIGPTESPYSFEATIDKEGEQQYPTYFEFRAENEAINLTLTEIDAAAHLTWAGALVIVTPNRHLGNLAADITIRGRVEKLVPSANSLSLRPHPKWWQKSGPERDQAISVLDLGTLKPFISITPLNDPST